MGFLDQYRTPEPPDALWFEQANYIAVNIGLIAYGFHIVSFCACAYYLLKEKKGRGNWRWLSIVFFLFACGTVNISVNMRFNQWAWIDLRGYPGGPLAFLLQEQAAPLQVGGNAVSILIGFVADALLIYRVHVVYQKWLVIIIPILTWLASTVMGIFFVIQSSQPASAFWSPQTHNFALPYFCLVTGLNILLTLLLVGRLLYMRAKVTKALGARHGETYSNIAAMILESATMYGLVSFVFLVLYAMGNTAALLFIPLYIQVQCMSPILIILRVARGRAWTAETISEQNLSRIQFGKKVAGSTNFNSNTAVNSSYNGRAHDVSLGTYKVSSSVGTTFSKEQGAEAV